MRCGVQGGWPTVRTVAVVCLLALVVPFARPAAAQTQAAVRYTGTLLIGTTPAPVGTPIVALSDQSTTPIVCGSASVSGATGRYTLEIQPTPDTCVARSIGSVQPSHIFMVKGENVRVFSPAGPPRLDVPTSLGGTQTVNLTATDVPNLVHGRAPNAPLNAVRYYGTVTITGTMTPALPGTAVTILSSQTVTPTLCGVGIISDTVGNYVVDVVATPVACVQSGRAVAPQHAFQVNGTTIAQIAPAGQPRLDQPATLAKVQRVNLTMALSPVARTLAFPDAATALSVAADTPTRNDLAIVRVPVGTVSDATTIQLSRVDPGRFRRAGLADRMTILADTPETWVSVGSAVMMAAQRTADGAPLAALAKPVQIVISYTALGISGLNPETATIFRYDPLTGTYTPLASTVDKNAETVTASDVVMTRYVLFLKGSRVFVGFGNPPTS